ncbi:MAG: hypothetical protein QOC93_4216 [Actinomycetota bacterium]|jgi:hypothetical protein|nr:hypothetical protein [Actinomycetota bacterium]
MSAPVQERPTRRALQPTDRNAIANRLLASSAKASYDPMVEIDWDAPLPDGLYGMTPEWSSLYGTPLWESMSEADRITLTKHEFASISGVGIWFEMILMHLVLRDIYDQDPATPHVQYALTEIADECRHSVMFARAAEKFGAPSYGPTRHVNHLGRIFKTLTFGPNVYAGILVAEEILDIFQRDMIKDERVQPITRTASRIHVVEEARHMRFAREEIVRRTQHMNWFERQEQRAVLATVAYYIATSLVHPDVYRSVGLDPKVAKRVARNNEHYTEKLRNAASGLTEFLNDVGLIGGPSVRLWKKANLL